MNSQPMNEANLSTVDLVFSLMDSPPRPLDFTLIFHLKKLPEIESLRIGARSARNFYPTTGSYVDGKRWARFVKPHDGVAWLAVPSDKSATKVVEEFLDHSLNLQQQAPVQQLVITDGAAGVVKLVTRFHHAAADGLSAAMWLRHQLRVAYNLESPVSETRPFEELPLRSHPSPVKKSRFAFRGPAQSLWSPRHQPSHTRRWRTIKVCAAGLRAQCRRLGGFTYNDLLAACALEVFVRWNRMHDASPDGNHGRKVGLWLPVNIRRQWSSGFGNGTSRIRIYARYAETASLLEKCREVHRQVSWSIKHGEWAIADNHPLLRLPRRISGSLLRAYLNRPWVDMASGVFSHAERWGGADEAFRDVEKIESIGQLHRRYCVVINGATHCGETWLTFTYDPGLLSPACIERFVEMYQEQIALAERELRCAV